MEAPKEAPTAIDIDCELAISRDAHDDRNSRDLEQDTELFTIRKRKLWSVAKARVQLCVLSRGGRGSASLCDIEH